MKEMHMMNNVCKWQPWDIVYFKACCGALVYFTVREEVTSKSQIFFGIRLCSWFRTALNNMLQTLIWYVFLSRTIGVCVYFCLYLYSWRSQNSIHLIVFVLWNNTSKRENMLPQHKVSDQNQTQQSIYISVLAMPTVAITLERKLNALN